MLTKSSEMETPNLNEEQKDVIVKIQTKLVQLNASAKFVSPIDKGPIVSVYRFMPQGSTKVSQIEALADDFAIALGVSDVFVKRLPGESAVGIFVPNKSRTPVAFRDTMQNMWLASRCVDVNIPLNFGVDYLGKPFIEDLAKLPHLLITGSTGSGKSTSTATIIASLMYTKTPSEVQFVLSDTKQVEFTHFAGSSHLRFDIAKSVYETVEQLDYLIEEITERLRTIGKTGLHNIHEYNAHLVERLDYLSISKMPYIVLVIDELADILSAGERQQSDDNKRGPTIGKLTQAKLGTIVQKSRAAGVHVIACTQRSSVKVVEGNIKSNFPARLTFRLPTDADSRTILGTGGAEHLLSQGDMLYISPNRPGIARLHAPLTSIEDIKTIVMVSKDRI